MKEATDISGRHPIILDFIMTRDDMNGCGYFNDDQEAIQYAQQVSTNQEMKFRKHGIIPRALVEMMGRYWVFQGKNNPTYRNVSYSEFLTILMKGPYKSNAARQVGEKFYRDLLVKEMPWIERSFTARNRFYDGNVKKKPAKQKSKEVKSRSH